MPKYWGKQILSLGSFPEVGQKQKTEKKEKEERPKVGNNNSQLRIATPPRVVHAKPTGPIIRWESLGVSQKAMELKEREKKKKKHVLKATL